MRRARLLAVLATVIGGGVAVIASTQTWLDVTLDDGAAHTLAVPGASAVPVLAPLGLTALALGLALTVVGPVLRYVFGVIALAAGGMLLALVWSVAVNPPVSAVASTVTEATGLSGLGAVSSLVARIDATVWPWAGLAGSLLITAAGIITLATAHRWRGAGRRYRADTTVPGPAASRPHDAIDSWDDLSHGADPTA
ncbi:Trp biosynthesis-associated membrane protein [Microbacterium sp. zg.Y1090]|uniref:Trp biosynthesis-associated membrane protein n=1 Tax=Microbacterium TaxID=33882 RepID=UPI00214ACD9D|nr:MULTISPECIES: Trp biosynthesis-associated membrane protein [unclassified Microbacterium]MCR2811917.1 Trp biosynthesis-associated membrane protein [Microbacterium sp. zg.Y1084]MCR2818644.1 Trp biosynthesis-associated membrane protein [Microbacterium sp. zg.Y1090]MDL5486457.1 Trp biosynthesis-associated membrane protein [Microbacterium sp. zg-Y1211]WIM29642.1 Trp biosynthesis-associated membrane protein [Microbacterium sp. zg-Y1090]